MVIIIIKFYTLGLFTEAEDKCSSNNRDHKSNYIKYKYLFCCLVKVPQGKNSQGRTLRVGSWHTSPTFYLVSSSQELNLACIDKSKYSLYCTNPSRKEPFAILFLSKILLFIDKVWDEIERITCCFNFFNVTWAVLEQ